MLARKLPLLIALFAALAALLVFPTTAAPTEAPGGSAPWSSAS